MLSSPSAPVDSPAGDVAGRAFLAVLPVVRGVARAYFRCVRCPARRDDLVAEAVALAFVWCRRLVARGKDPAAFPVALARLAARAAACGRRVAGQGRAGDVMSPGCRRRHGFAVLVLPAGAYPLGAELADALAGHAKAPVPAQVQFRMDFPAWLARLPGRKGRVAVRLAAGHRTREVAAEIGVSPGRVSQMRAELRSDYLSFLSGHPGR